MQRISLLTLIILGEGIIVICKAISEIVKNGSFDFNGPITGQLISASMIVCKLFITSYTREYSQYVYPQESRLIVARLPLYVVLRPLA